MSVRGDRRPRLVELGRVRRGLRVLATAVAVACEGGSPPASVPDSIVEPAPEILIAGCEALLEGPVCELRSGATLRLWAAVHRDTPLVLEVDGVAHAVAWMPAEEGLQTTVEPAPGASTLVVHSADARWRWRLPLRRLDAHPALAPITALIDAERYDEARRAIEAALPDLDRRARAEALALLADIAFLTDALVESDATHAAAYTAAVEAGLFARASDLAVAVIHVAIEGRWDPKRAEAWLDRLAALTPRVTEARLRHHYCVGFLAERRGDLRRALPQLTEYARLSGALGHVVDRAAGLIEVGTIATALGDRATAAAALTELRTLEDRLDPLNRAKAINSRAWFALEARAHGAAAEDPEPAFAEALAIFRGRGAEGDAEEVSINLALAALLRGDAEAARASISALRPRTRRRGRWRELIAARIDALDTRPRDALRRFDALAREAAADDDLWIEWRATVGAGEALEALGDDEAALQRYLRAAALHSIRLSAVAIQSSPERLAAADDLAAQRAVGVLLRLGRAPEAACVARRARSQALANLAHASRDSEALADYRRGRAELEAAREAAWELPARRREEAMARRRRRRAALDEALDAALSGSVRGLTGPTTDPCEDLRPPAQGEVILLYYPLERGHAAFAINPDGAHGRTIDDFEGTVDEDPAARAERLLGPFTPAIAAASRLRVLISGRLGREPLHALPFGEGRLIDHVAVVYALDLPREAGPAQRPQRALQLAPLSNLAGAPSELRAGVEALRSRGVAVQSFTGDEPDLRARLGDVDLLHYVGHARGDGWQGALDLGGERALTVADLLSGPAPRLALLSGCETGLLDPEAHAGGISLAHALLLAGADAVLATDGEIPDAVAAAMSPAILAGLADGVDPAEVLRRVQRFGLRQSAESARFRAYVP